jgi:hypothetical protein
MPRDNRPAGWHIVADDRLTDTEKIAQLQAMLTEERAKNRRVRLRRTRIITQIAKEWEELFDETFKDREDSGGDCDS